MRALVPVGRILFAVIFVASVMGHFTSAEIAQASAHGVPLAHLLVPLSGIIALVGGVSVILGYHAKVGALTAAAWLSWAMGRSSHAGTYVDEALRLEPGHSMASLISNILAAAMLPEWALRRP